MRNHSGGLVGSAKRYAIVATAMILSSGFTSPNTLEHLVIQLALSGHLFLVSQHLQSLLSNVPAAPCIAFMQSDMSMPASAATMLPCCSPGCAAANADPSGARVSEKAIRIAKNVRKAFSAKILQSVILS